MMNKNDDEEDGGGADILPSPRKAPPLKAPPAPTKRGLPPQYLQPPTWKLNQAYARVVLKNEGEVVPDEGEQETHTQPPQQPRSQRPKRLFFMSFVIRAADDAKANEQVMKEICKLLKQTRSVATIATASMSFNRFKSRLVSPLLLSPAHASLLFAGHSYRSPFATRSQQCRDHVRAVCGVWLCVFLSVTWVSALYRINQHPRTIVSSDQKTYVLQAVNGFFLDGRSPLSLSSMAVCVGVFL
jgi:hypothetical protein